MVVSKRFNTFANEIKKQIKIKIIMRTNCKKAVENIRKYIIENYDGDGYELEPTEDFKEVAQNILNTFWREKVEHDCYYKANRIFLQELFYDWCQGLPSILNTCYYYNRSAVKDVQMILEQSDETAAKYEEDDAQHLLTWLIWRELTKVANI